MNTALVYHKKHSPPILLLYIQKYKKEFILKNIITKIKITICNILYENKNVV